MKHWLYPISKRSGYVFEDVHGRRTKDTSYESFRDYVLTGKIRDTTWGVTRNIGRVSEGDHVYIYTGDRDHGIIAVGKITGVDQPDGSVEFELDEKKSAQLITHPVPAPKVRPLIAPPRSALVNITDAMPRLSRLLPWSPVFREAEASRLKRLKLKRITSVQVHRGKSTWVQWLRHDSVLGPIRLILAARNFTVGQRSFGRLQVDMVGERGGVVVVVEAKTIVTGKGRNEARAAVGQLLEYAWLLKTDSTRPIRVVHWLAFSQTPNPRVATFAAAQGFVVSWPEAGKTKIRNRSLLPQA